MRLLLQFAGKNSAGMVERAELQQACEDVLQKYPAAPAALQQPAALTPVVVASQAAAAAAASGDRLSSSGAAGPSKGPAAGTSAKHGKKGANRRHSAKHQGQKSVPHATSASTAGRDDSDSDEDSDQVRLVHKADRAKLRGNEFFGKDEFVKAVLQYSIAIRLRPGATTDHCQDTRAPNAMANTVMAALR